MTDEPSFHCGIVASGTTKYWREADCAYRARASVSSRICACGRNAQRVAGNSRRWWRNSAKLLNSVLTIAYFDRLGLP